MAMSLRPVVKRPAAKRGRNGKPPDELMRLPSVGPKAAADLRSLGVRSVKDLARRDPEKLYASLCRLTGVRQDPCVLYGFRCAVYAAGTPGPAPELLKWWNWKGRKLERRDRSAPGRVV
jgi:hypothetical protein